MTLDQCLSTYMEACRNHPSASSDDIVMMESVLTLFTNANRLVGADELDIDQLPPGWAWSVRACLGAMFPSNVVEVVIGTAKVFLELAVDTGIVHHNPLADQTSTAAELSTRASPMEALLESPGSSASTERAPSLWCLSWNAATG